MQKETAELVKATLWPFVALLALIMFFGPVHSVLTSLARRADQIQVFKLGYLELNIKASDLPKATKKTAEALAQFDEEMVRRLIFVPSTSPYFGSCHRRDIESSVIEKRALEKLALLNQVKLAKVESPPADCPEYYSGELTKDGIETRDFLFKFISTQLKGSGKSD
jgi:hypothetical protein